MTNTRTFKTLKHKATSLLAAAALISMATPAKSEDRSHSQIEGSWLVTNTRINQGFSFTAVVSFGAGGVLLATGSIAVPALLQGGWARVDSYNVDSTIYFFPYDSAGNAVAMIKVVQSFQMTSTDELIGTGTSYACDLRGENCKEDPTVRIRITGRRIASERQREF